jgi:hypothetical protein
MARVFTKVIKKEGFLSEILCSSPNTPNLEPPIPGRGVGDSVKKDD